MGLTRPTEVREWCRARGFRPSRVLGQNFLVDRNIRDIIVAAAGLRPGDRVLEVGPGLGAVTEALLAAGVRVTAVEKDRRLATWLRESLGGEDGLTLIEADILELDLDRLLAGGEAGGALAGASEAAPPFFAACVSNLPYSAGTRILLEVCRRAPAPELMVVTLQREVAERLAAPAGGHARGLASVRVQQRYDVVLLRDIGAGCFWPRPDVGSTLVRLRRHERLPLAGGEREMFEALVSRAFMHRRKQMLPLLRLAAAEMGVALPPAGALPVAAGARPGDLDNEQWHRLARAMAAAAAH
jgi:16S rRNA (adenine1518-N6/adenine1519-N6)-dimethyltransferase